jgi:hypothetical protein
VTARYGEGLGDRFVERLRRHVEPVRSLVQIMDNDRAGFEGARRKFTIFAICSPVRLTLYQAIRGNTWRSLGLGMK